MSYLEIDAGGEMHTQIAAVFLLCKKVNTDFVMHSIRLQTKLDFNIWYIFNKSFGFIFYIELFFFFLFRGMNQITRGVHQIKEIGVGFELNLLLTIPQECQI